MSYQCNGKNGSTKITLTSNSNSLSGELYDCNFYLTEYIKNEMELRVLRLESSIISVPTYLAKVYLEGSHQCGPHFGDFDATDESLVYLAGIFMDQNPFNVSIEYLIMVDRVLFC